MPAEDRDYKLEEILETYRLDGSMIRSKARVLTEEGLDQLYHRMVDGELSTTAFLDIMKYLAEIGDLKPKQSTTPQQTGPGFSITINIPNKDGAPPITLEAVPIQTEEGVMGEVPIAEIPFQDLKKLGEASAGDDS